MRKYGYNEDADRIAEKFLTLVASQYRRTGTIVEKYEGGPVGLDTIAVSVSEDPETVEDVYEPFLMQLGFLARTPRGRVATKLAYDHLGLVKASSGEQPRLF